MLIVEVSGFQAVGRVSPRWPGWRSVEMEHEEKAISCRTTSMVISEAVKLKQYLLQYLLQTHCVYKGDGEVLFRLCGFGVHRSAVCQGSVIAPFSSASHV